MINHIFAAGLGFLAGWLVFKRPDVATQWIEATKKWLKSMGGSGG